MDGSCCDSPLGKQKPVAPGERHGKKKTDQQPRSYTVSGKTQLDRNGNGQHEPEKQSRLAQNGFAKNSESAFSHNFSPLWSDTDHLKFSTREKLELAQERLDLIQDFLIEVASKDPDFFGQLMLPASKISRAAEETENALRSRWINSRRWDGE